MDRWIGSLVVMFVLAVGASSRAATIDVIAAFPSISVSPGGSETLVLKLKNAEASAAEIVAWQVALAVEPQPGSLGTVEISGFSTPVDYVFNGFPAFGIAHLFGDGLPSTQAIFTDANLLSETNASIGEQSSAGLLIVTLSVSPNAVGEFRILMPSLTGDFSDSFWIDPNEQDPMPFGNNGHGATLSQRTLAIMHVTGVPEPSAVIAAIELIALASCLCHRRQSRQVRLQRQSAPNQLCDGHPAFS